MEDKIDLMRDTPDIDEITRGRANDWSRIRSVLILIVTVVLGLSVFGATGVLQFVLLDDTNTVLSVIAPLLLYSLFIERTAEVFVTVWRGKESDAISLMVTQEKDRLAVSQLKDIARLQKLERILTQYKTTSRDVAFVFSLICGVAMSMSGVRILEHFVDPTSFDSLVRYQYGVFEIVDIVVTGAAIGGGADGMHKITSLFTTFLETSRAKVASSK